MTYRLAAVLAVAGCVACASPLPTASDAVTAAATPRTATPSPTDQGRGGLAIEGAYREPEERGRVSIGGWAVFASVLEPDGDAVRELEMGVGTNALFLSPGKYLLRIVVVPQSDDVTIVDGVARRYFGDPAARCLAQFSVEPRRLTDVGLLVVGGNYCDLEVGGN